MKYSITLILLVLCATCHKTVAQDISQTVIQGGQPATNQNGGFLDLGLGLALSKQLFFGYPEGNRNNNIEVDTELNLVVNGRYQYHRWFVEVFSTSIAGLNVGYNVVDNENWSADIIISPIFGYLGEKTSDDWRDLNEREAVVGTGLRLSYFKRDNIFQFRLLYGLGETEVPDAVNASIYYGYTWQVRNWNFHVLSGFEYYNKQVVDHLFGVSEAEAALNPELFAYEAGAASFGVAEIGGAYPIAEDWIFRAQYRYSHIFNNASDSPLLVSNREHLFFATVSYVF